MSNAEQSPRPPGLGFSLVDETLGVDGLARLGQVADEAGYSDVWGLELGGYDGVAISTATIMRTKQARVGCAILNVFSRTPFSLAMTAATLAELSAGRFCLGLGTSSAQVVEAWHGTEFRRPLNRVREYIETVRALLAGERVTYDGQAVTLAGARLQCPPAQPVPIWIAALGPKMLQLAGQHADGLLLTMVGPQAAGAMAETARQAAAEHARTLEVACRVLLPFPGDDPAAVDAVRQVVADYSLIPVYRAMFGRLGLEADVERIAAARASGGRKAALQAVSDRLLTEFACVGPAEEQYQQLLRFREQGVAPMLTVFPAPGEPAARQEATEEAARWFAMLDARERQVGGR